MPKIVQDLSVLVAQVETGVLVDLTDPNYAPFSNAAQAITNVLQRVLTRNSMVNTFPQGQDTSPLDSFVPQELDWAPWTAGQHACDFELDFWLNLAEHPALSE